METFWIVLYVLLLPCVTWIGISLTAEHYRATLKPFNSFIVGCAFFLWFLDHLITTAKLIT